MVQKNVAVRKTNKNGPVGQFLVFSKLLRVQQIWAILWSSAKLYKQNYINIMQMCAQTHVQMLTGTHCANILELLRANVVKYCNIAHILHSMVAG